MIEETFKYLLFHQIKAILLCSYLSYKQAERYKFLLRRIAFETWKSSFLTEVGWLFTKTFLRHVLFVQAAAFYSMDVADMDGRKWILVIVNHKPPVLSSVDQSFVGIQLQQTGNIIQDPNNNLRRANNYFTISVLADRETALWYLNLFRNPKFVVDLWKSSHPLFVFNTLFNLLAGLQFGFSLRTKLVCM